MFGNRNIDGVADGNGDRADRVRDKENETAMDQRGREGAGGMKICILIEGLRQFCVKTGGYVDESSQLQGN